MSNSLLQNSHGIQTDDRLVKLALLIILISMLKIECLPCKLQGTMSVHTVTVCQRAGFTTIGKFVPGSSELT